MNTIDDVDTKSHLSETVQVSSVNAIHAVGGLVYLSQVADWGPHPR